jgi:hypothetical protein
MVESGPFRLLISDLMGAAGASVDFCSRITAGRWAEKVAVEDFNEVKGIIAMARDKGVKFAITADYGSTKGTMKPLLGATATWIEPDWSAMPTAAIGAKYSPGSHETEKVLREIFGIMVRAGLSAKDGTSFTHDGGSNMQGVDLGNNSLLDIPCDAHKLANIPKHVLKMQPPPPLPKEARIVTRSFKDMFDNAHSIVTSIRASPMRREYFLQLQEGLTDSAGHLVRPRMLALGAEHKFIYSDIEIDSILELAHVIVLVSASLAASVHAPNRQCPVCVCMQLTVQGRRLA